MSEILEKKGSRFVIATWIGFLLREKLIIGGCDVLPNALQSMVMLMKAFQREEKGKGPLSFHADLVKP